MKMHKKVLGWLVDTVYAGHCIVTTIIHKNPPHHYLGHVIDGKVPVVIIPGIFSQWGFMKKIADTISLLGHPVYIVPELGYNLHDIPHSSSLVSKVIQKENLKNVIFVAHSKGGLIGKYTLIHHNEENRIIGMVSVATPYSGSAMTKILPIEPVKELHNDSIIIKDIAGHTAVNKNIVSISPEYDHYVWAEEGSYLEGAKNIVINVHGHHAVMYDKRVIDSIQESIEQMSQDLYRAE
jgi:pimeloyl-ACP methyl ester carboxylesterase